MPIQMNEGIFSEKSLIFAKCILATLGFFFGFFGVFFCIWKSNYNAVVSSLLLEIVCTLLLRYNVYYIKGTLQVKTSPTTLRAIKIFSIIIFILLFASGIGDIYLGYKNEQGFHIEQDGYYYAAIPSFLGSIMSLLLFFDSIKFAAVLDVPTIHLQGI